MRASERAWMSKVPRSGNSRTIYHGKFFAKRLRVCESITGKCAIPSVPTSCTAAMYNSSCSVIAEGGGRDALITRLLPLIPERERRGGGEIIAVTKEATLPSAAGCVEAKQSPAAAATAATATEHDAALFKNETVITHSLSLSPLPLPCSRDVACLFKLAF